ncbi:MAG: ABC transporter ATP-binding protein/permease [Defluviitaleaceae bacterium]|nr:ABC transporter ATP-binding protein/permease [Defluviitaleaceae bacterium]
MLRNLAQYIDGKTRLIFAFIILVVLAGRVFTLWPIRLIEAVVNLAVLDATHHINSIIMIGIVYCLSHAAGAFANAANLYLCAYLQTDMGVKIQNRLYTKLLRVRLAVLQNRNSIEITNALIEDTAFVCNNLVTPMVKVFTALSSFALGLFFMLNISWQLTLIILPCGLVTSISARLIQKKSEENIEGKRDKSNILWKIFTEGIRGIIPIRVYRHDKAYGDMVKTASKEMKAVSLAQEKLKAINLFFMSVLFMTTIGGIMIFSGIFVVRGLITIGALAAVMMYNHMLIDPLIDVLDIQQDIIKLNVSLRRIFKLLSLPDDENAGKDIVKIDTIVLDNLSFSYDENAVLYENITLTINSPCNLWVKGESGSGKTTLVNIIAGLYPPSAGKLRYFCNNNEVHGLPKISYLIQDGYLFDRSIADNIKIANPNISDEKISQLIAVCRLGDVIAVHKDKPVGENGSLLSGGEKKRLRLAQMLAVDDADLFIFDELTSSLDEAVAFEIMNNILDMKLNKICLFIEHNTMVAAFFKECLVVDEGKLCWSTGRKYRPVDHSRDIPNLTK